MSNMKYDAITGSGIEIGTCVNILRTDPGRRASRWTPRSRPVTSRWGLVPDAEELKVRQGPRPQRMNAPLAQKVPASLRPSPCCPRELRSTSCAREHMPTGAHAPDQNRAWFTVDDGAIDGTAQLGR